MIPFVSGVVFIGIAAVYWQNNHRFVQTAEQVAGAVIEVVESRGDKGGKLYAPVVKFTDHRGQQQKFQSRLSSNPQRYFVDDKVQVLYDKDNPRTAVIDSWWELNLMPFVLLIIGIANVFVSVIFASVAFFVYRSRRNRSAGLNAVIMEGRANVERSAGTR